MYKFDHSLPISAYTTQIETQVYTKVEEEVIAYQTVPPCCYWHQRERDENLHKIDPKQYLDEFVERRSLPRPRIPQTNSVSYKPTYPSDLTQQACNKKFPFIEETSRREIIPASKYHQKQVSQPKTPYSYKLKRYYGIDLPVVKLISWEENAAYMLVNKDKQFFIMKSNPSNLDEARCFVELKKKFKDIIVGKNFTAVSYEKTIEIYQTPDDFFSKIIYHTFNFDSSILGCCFNENNLLVRTKTHYVLYNLNTKIGMWFFEIQTDHKSSMVQFKNQYILSADSGRYVHLLKKDRYVELNRLVPRLTYSPTVAILDDPWIFIGDSSGELYYYNIDWGDFHLKKISSRFQEPVLNILTYPDGILIVSKTSLSFCEKKDTLLVPYDSPPTFFSFANSGRISILKQIETGVLVMNTDRKLLKYED